MYFLTPGRPCQLKISERPLLIVTLPPFGGVTVRVNGIRAEKGLVTDPAKSARTCQRKTPVPDSCSGTAAGVGIWENVAVPPLGSTTRTSYAIAPFTGSQRHVGTESLRRALSASGCGVGRT